MRRRWLLARECVPTSQSCSTPTDLAVDRDEPSRGGTIRRCIDISRYFSRDTYHDIIFYNHNFFFFFFFGWYNDFHLGRKAT